MDEQLMYAKNVNIFKEKSVMSDIDSKPTYIIRDYGSSITYKQETTNSSSNANFSINLNFPNGITGIMDRHPHIQQEVVIDFVGTSTGGQNLLQSGFDAPAAFALTKSMRNQTITLQTMQINVPIAEILNCLMWFEKEFDQYKKYMTPSCLDNSQQFSDLSNTVNNVLGSVLDGTLDSLEPRGSFPYEIVSNTPTSAQVKIVFREPFFLSPFIYDLSQANGLSSINKIDLQVDYTNNPGNLMWSHNDDSGNTISAITCNYGTPSLVVRFVNATGTDKEEMIKEPNKQRVLPYSYPVKYTTQITQTVVPGQFLSNQPTKSMSVKAVPNKLLIWCAPNYYDRSYNDPEYTLSIERCEVSFAGRDSLGKASKGQLFEINKKNNYRGSWRDWSGEPSSVSLGSSPVKKISGSASYLCLKFGKDIQIPSNTYPGTSGTYDLQIMLDLVNRRSTNVINPLIYVIVVYEGYLTIAGQLVNTSLSAITLKQAEDAKLIEGGYYGTHDLGGNIFGDIGSFFKHKVLPLARDIIKSPITKELSNILFPVVKKLIGMGYTEEQALKMLKKELKYGGELVSKRKNGGELVPFRKGGKLANKDLMLKRMLKYR